MQEGVSGEVELLRMSLLSVPPLVTSSNEDRTFPEIWPPIMQLGTTFGVRVVMNTSFSKAATVDVLVRVGVAAV
jgi:hypothetical protein